MSDDLLQLQGCSAEALLIIIIIIIIIILLHGAESFLRS
jgi:hypothetical protein